MPKIAYKLFPLVLGLLLLALLACGPSTATPQSPLTPATEPPIPVATTTPSPQETEAPTTTPTLTPTATPTPPAPALPPAIEEALARVTQALPGVRGLEFRKEVPAMLMTSQELRDFLTEDLTSEDREELEAAGDLYVILGLMDPGRDLVQLSINLLGEQVLGLFDPESEELFVVTDAEDPGVLEELTLAHEYVHALQQQYFDIYALGQEAKGNQDQDAALTALIEGDATMTELAYGFQQYTPLEIQRALGQVGPTPVLDSAPDIVQRSLSFPYLEGFNFVQALFDSGSWEALNNAFGNPPRSTEQVLHPELYLQGHEPLDAGLPSFQGLLDLGWQVVDENTLGEFFIFAMLDGQMGTLRSQEASRGWGGDRYALLEDPNGRQTLALNTLWDTPQDAEEFLQAFEFYTDRALPPNAAVHTSRDGPQVLVVVSPNGESRDLALEELAPSS